MGLESQDKSQALWQSEAARGSVGGDSWGWPALHRQESKFLPFSPKERRRVDCGGDH